MVSEQAKTLHAFGYDEFLAPWGASSISMLPKWAMRCAAPKASSNWNSSMIRSRSRRAASRAWANLQVPVLQRVERESNVLRRVAGLVAEALDRKLRSGHIFGGLRPGSA